MKKIIKNIIGILLIAYVIWGYCYLVSTHGAPVKNGKYDVHGETYIFKSGKLQIGLFKYKGSYYYGYYSKSCAHSKGSIAKNCYKIIKDKMYFFDSTGRRLNRNTRYIKLNKYNNSVHYIYMPGTRNERYNANHKRYQKKVCGKWRDVGMQCYPYGMIEWQW